ncbi:DUF2393 family protein [Sulfurospirillum arcachonense]|uniref:DUF2393 family protein n=1 Tax=Sulfurospirillum arcachonense TaxID=57666 RepID=UPI0004694A54|nr:DUF2393 family protein [Sulfurospirillum arcachonense]
MFQLEGIKNAILIYVNNFSMYDYVGFAWLILIFFVTILLAVVMAKKSPVFSIFIFIISLILLFAGPFILKNYLDDYLRGSTNKTLLVKKLHFSNALIVNGEVTNISQKNFYICNVTISLLNQSDNYIKNIFNQLKPLRKQTISIDEPIEVNSTKEFRVVFDQYTQIDDINVTINSVCY